MATLIAIAYHWVNATFNNNKDEVEAQEPGAVYLNQQT